MESQSENAWKSVARRLSAVSFIFLILIGLGGISIGFHLQDSTPLAAGLFFGVGTSVLATVVTSVINSWINTQVQLNALQASIRNNVQSVLSDVQKETFRQITAEFPKFIPAFFFPATKNRNPEFESELCAAIEESRQYFFRGATGRHVPIWLEMADTRNLHVTVLVLNPNNRDFLTLYAKDRSGAGKQLTADQVDNEVKNIVNEIYSAVVGLFDSRHLCPITIKMHNGPVFFRSEMFDSKCFVSFYIDGTGTNYPGTYVYKRDSLIYSSFRKDINDCVRLETEEFVIKHNSGESDLKAFLDSLGYVGDIKTLRNDFAEFKTGYLAAP